MGGSEFGYSKRATIRLSDGESVKNCVFSGSLRPANRNRNNELMFFWFHKIFLVLISNILCRSGRGFADYA
jgi:hypothetical protein